MGRNLPSRRVPRRKPLRLAAFDYGAPRSYFVTMVAQNRRCVFGRVEQGEVRLSIAGKMLLREWRRLADRYVGIGIEPFVVMPNHVHGLVSTCQMTAPPSLGRVVGAFKSITAREYRTGEKVGCWPSMPDGLWQRGYFDHVVRDEADEMRIIEYINANPVNWVSDPDNPESLDPRGDDERRWPRGRSPHKRARGGKSRGRPDR